MPTLLRYIAIVSCMASTAFAESSDVNALVGEWGYERAGGFACVLRFKSDGTFDGQIGDTNRQIVFEGTWERKEDKIYYVYGKPRPGSKDEDRIIEITADRLVTEDLGHNVQRYHRLSTPPKRPNKAPEPTSTLGTSATELPRVPSALVAHL